MGGSLYITVILLLAAGILAVSGLIIAKKPSAKDLIDKLVPFQGFIGVALLAWGIIDLVRGLSWGLFTLMKVWPMGGAIIFIAILSEIFLGFLFGMPLIAKWIPGDSPAEQKAQQMQQKIAGFSVILGIIGIVAAVGLLLMQWGIIKPGSIAG